ncbi:MAG: flgE [Acidimicrobiia bacterium]|nr:flgE [Acidimicrobiia bacterium]
MIRSMFTAISGLRAHQQMIDVTGNNIANVNTSGFKSSSVVFQDILSQTLRGAGAPATAVGGTNPAQVGLGVTANSITTNLVQGALQRTNRPDDIAVEGDGYFMLDNNGSQQFTRNGAFSTDGSGRLVSQDGAFVMGWQANAQTGVINTNSTPTTLQIPVGQLMSPQATALITMGGNMASATPLSPAPGSTLTTTVNVYDAGGTPTPLTFTWTHTALDTWTVAGAYTNGGGPQTTATHTLVFNPAAGPNAGELKSVDGVAAATTFGATVNGVAMNVDLGLPTDPSRVTQFASTKSLTTLKQDGSPEGSLERYSIAQDGTISGAFSNGKTQAIGQLAMAIFTNPEGLEKVGGNNLGATANSGLPEIGVAGQGGRGVMSAGSLEMSNVDLAQEFTNLIVGQRGFQANSKVITTSDELLQDLVNLKR